MIVTIMSKNTVRVLPLSPNFLFLCTYKKQESRVKFQEHVTFEHISLHETRNSGHSRILFMVSFLRIPLLSLIRRCTHKYFFSVKSSVDINSISHQSVIRNIQRNSIFINIHKSFSLAPVTIIIEPHQPFHRVKIKKSGVL